MRHPGGFALGQLLIRKLYVQGALGDIDFNDIAVLKQSDFAALGSLGRDMSDCRAAGSAGEAAVRDEGYSAPRPRPTMAEVGFSISRIPGPPLGPS